MIKKIILLVLLGSSILFAQQTNLSNMFRLAKSFEKSGEFEQAKKIYEDIYKQQPWNLQFLEGLNNVYLALKEYDKSVDLLTSKIKSEPANVNLYGMLGDTYYTQGDTTKAFNTWDEGIAKSDKNFVAYRVMTNHALQKRAFEKVIEYLQEGKKLKQNASSFALDLARVYSMTMNFDKAATEYCNLVLDDPTMSQVAVRSMMQYLNRPQALEETISSVEEFSKENSVPEIYRILINLYQLKDDYMNALANIDKLESESDSNGKEYFKFAQEMLRSNQYKVASEAFGKLIEEYPNSPFIPASRIGYAKSFEESLNSKRDSSVSHWKPYHQNEVIFEQEYQDAIKSYEKIYELYPNSDVKSEALFRIAGIYYDKLNQPDKAREYYKRILNSNAVSQFQFDSNLRMADIFINDGKIEDAENKLVETIKSFNLPDDYKSKVTLLLGKVYFWEGKFKSATKELSKVTQNLFDDNANDALQLMTLINTLKNDSITLADYAEAELLAERDQFSEAAEDFEKLKNSQNPIISELAALKYAQVLIAQNKYSMALDILNKTGEESSLKMFDADIQYLKGEIKFFALKDYEGALEAYRNVLENYDNSLYFDKSRIKIETINELKKKSI